MRLGDLCSKIGSGATPRGGGSAYHTSGVALVRSQNIYNDGFQYDGLAFLGDAQAAALDNVTLRENDVLLNITGDSVARACVLPSRVLPARVNQHVAIIRPKPSVLNHRFLHFWLTSPMAQEFLLQLASAGATRKALTKGMIEDLDLPDIPKADQDAIASCLGALDDKIDLNRRTNQTLEALARALFAHHFPHDPEDDLPAGWKPCTLAEIAEINPSRSLLAGTPAPYLEMANMPTTSARALAWKTRAAGSGLRFKNGDVLVARITPCLENGKTAFVDFLQDGQVGWGSTEYIVIRSKPPVPPEYAYLLARTDDFRAHVIQNMTGTSGRQRASADCLTQYEVVRPPDDLLTKFGSQVATFFKALKANDDESYTLAALRDTLLPKLMSGETCIPQAEKEIASHA